MRPVVFLFLFCPLTIMAQDLISYKEADSASYAAYSTNDLKSIRKTGRRALKSGADFFYLRMRLGITGFNHEKYEFALIHFEAAYDMNPADTTVQEYLYFSYLWTNRVENANELGAKMNSSLQQKVGYRPKRLHSISIGNIALMNDNNRQSTVMDLLENTYKKGNANVNCSAFGQHILFESAKKNRFKYYNKISIFETSTVAIEQYNAPIVIKRTKDYFNTQLQYNWGMSHISQRGGLVGLGLAYFRTKTSDLTSHPTPNGNVVFIDSAASYSNFLMAATLGKRMRYFYPTLGMTYSNLYSERQLQVEFSLTYYPLGNGKLFGTSAGAFLNNNGSIQGVLTQKLGVSCTSWLWLEGKYSLGNHQNYMSSNGFLSYNTLDPITFSRSLDVHLHLRKLELVLGYCRQNRVGTFNQYIAPQEVQAVNYLYINNNFMSTILWKF